MSSVRGRISGQGRHQRVFRGDEVSTCPKPGGSMRAPEVRGVPPQSCIRRGRVVDRSKCWVFHLAEPNSSDSGKER